MRTLRPNSVPRASALGPTVFYTPWAYVVGFVLATVAFAGWGWPRGTKPEDQVTRGRLPRTVAPPPRSAPPVASKPAASTAAMEARP